MGLSCNNFMLLFYVKSCGNATGPGCVAMNISVILLKIPHLTAADRFPSDRWQCCAWEAQLLQRFCLWLVVCLMVLCVAACGVVNGGFQTVAGVWGSISGHKLELSECHSISSLVWETITSVLLLHVCVCVCVKWIGRWWNSPWWRRKVSEGCFQSFSLIYFLFFVSHHLPPCLIYTHTHPNLWSGEQNRDGRWSRVLSELLAAHLLQSRQQDTSHRGPNSPDLYLAITHSLPCRHANCLSDHPAF